MLHETVVTVQLDGESFEHGRRARHARLVAGILHVTIVSCNLRFMGEHSERREELLEKIVDALLENGISDLSLRPLAGKVGSSARLLIYHFGTKENLVECALAIVRSRVEQSLQALAARKQPNSLKASLLMFWDWATEDLNQRYFRLLFEVDGLSMHNKPTASNDFRADGGLVWRQMIERVTKDFPQNERAASGRSTLIMAALNGLLQDFFSTGDHARTTAGLHYLIRIIMSADRATPGKATMKNG